MRILEEYLATEVTEVTELNVNMQIKKRLQIR